jgi:hypothetical protein
LGQEKGKETKRVITITQKQWTLGQSENFAEFFCKAKCREPVQSTKGDINMGKKLVMFLAVCLLSLTFAIPSFAAEKVQSIKVTPISRANELNCGSKDGSIEAIYEGNNIEIIFKYPVRVIKGNKPVKDWFDYVCANTRRPAKLAGKKVLVQGRWHKNTLFEADKFFY